MDWSLVLASQGIEHIINYDETTGWILIVSTADHPVALDHIHEYCLENRYWRWRHPVFQPGLYFDWSCVIWAFANALMFAGSQRHNLHDPGMMTGAALHSGEWWRLFTAILLHADLAHLAMNIVFGMLFLGLAMGSYGPGVGLLAAYLAGAAGNLVGSWIHEPNLHSLGSSGMVMGALGLLACPPLILPKGRRIIAFKLLGGGLLAGILIFVMIGMNPNTDVVAHLGGFISGWLLGIPLCLKPKLIRTPRINLAAGIFFCLLIFVPWWLALTHT